MTTKISFRETMFVKDVLQGIVTVVHHVHHTDRESSQFTVTIDRASCEFVPMNGDDHMFIWTQTAAERMMLVIYAMRTGAEPYVMV